MPRASLSGAETDVAVAQVRLNPGTHGAKCRTGELRLNNDELEKINKALEQTGFRFAILQNSEPDSPSPGENQDFLLDQEQQDLVGVTSDIGESQQQSLLRRHRSAAVSARQQISKVAGAQQTSVKQQQQTTTSPQNAADESPSSAAVGRASKRRRNNEDYKTSRLSSSEAVMSTAPPPSAAPPVQTQPPIPLFAPSASHLAALRQSQKPPIMTTGTWQDACTAAMSDIMSHEHAHWFICNPENHAQREYFERVKFPMDLQTVQQKLGESMYTHPFRWQEDIRSICYNAFLCFPEGTPIWNNAQTFPKYFEELLKQRFELNPYAIYTSPEARAAAGQTPAAISSTAQQTTTAVADLARQLSSTNASGQIVLDAKQLQELLQQAARGGSTELAPLLAAVPHVGGPAIGPGSAPASVAAGGGGASASGGPLSNLYGPLGGPAGGSAPGIGALPAAPLSAPPVCGTGGPLPSADEAKASSSLGSSTVGGKSGRTSAPTLRIAPGTRMQSEESIAYASNFPYPASPIRTFLPEPPPPTPALPSQLERTNLTPLQKKAWLAKFRDLDVLYRKAALDLIRDELDIHPVFCAKDSRYTPCIDWLPLTKQKQFFIYLKNLFMAQKKAVDEQKLPVTGPRILFFGDPDAPPPTPSAQPTQQPPLPSNLAPSMLNQPPPQPKSAAQIGQYQQLVRGGFDQQQQQQQPPMVPSLSEFGGKAASSSSSSSSSLGGDDRDLSSDEEKEETRFAPTSTVQSNTQDDMITGSFVPMTDFLQILPFAQNAAAVDSNKNRQDIYGNPGPNPRTGGAGRGKEEFSTVSPSLMPIDNRSGSPTPSDPPVVQQRNYDSNAQRFNAERDSAAGFFFPEMMATSAEKTVATQPPLVASSKAIRRRNSGGEASGGEASGEEASGGGSCEADPTTLMSQQQQQQQSQRKQSQNSLQQQQQQQQQSSLRQSESSGSSSCWGSWKTKMMHKQMKSMGADDHHHHHQQQQQQMTTTMAFDTEKPSDDYYKAHEEKFPVENSSMVDNDNSSHLINVNDHTASSLPTEQEKEAEEAEAEI